MNLTPDAVVARFQAICAATGHSVTNLGEYLAIDGEQMRVRIGALVEHCRRVPEAAIDDALREHLEVLLSASASVQAPWASVADRTILAACDIHRANQLPMAFSEFIPMANGLVAAPCVEGQHQRQFPVRLHPGQPEGPELIAHAARTLCDNLAVVCQRLDRNLLAVDALFHGEPISPATLLSIPVPLVAGARAALAKAGIAGDPVLVAASRDVLLLTGHEAADGLRSLERHVLIADQRSDALTALPVRAEGDRLVPWVPPTGAGLRELRDLALKDGARDWEGWKRHLHGDGATYIPGVQVITVGRGALALASIATPVEIPLWVDYLVVPTTEQEVPDATAGAASIIPAAALWADPDTWEPGRTPFSRRSLRSTAGLNHLARQHQDFARWLAGQAGDRSRN